MLVGPVVLVVEEEIKVRLELLDLVDLLLVLLVEQQTVFLQHRDGEIVEGQEVHKIMQAAVEAVEQVLLELLELDHILLVLVDPVEMVSHIQFLGHP
jgi:hypothetical protein